jgi:hypothetical protein
MAGDFWDFKYLNRNGIFLDPDGILRPQDEFKLARDFTKEFVSKLPLNEIVESNHDARLFKRTKEAYIPSFLLKSYRDILDLGENIKFGRCFTHYNGQVVVEHGHAVKGSSYTSFERHLNKRITSVVFAHHHARSCILYDPVFVADDPDRRLQRFVMNVGACVDELSEGMAYARDTLLRSSQTIGVLVWDGKKRRVTPHLIPIT